MILSDNFYSSGKISALVSIFDSNYLLFGFSFYYELSMFYSLVNCDKYNKWKYF